MKEQFNGVPENLVLIMRFCQQLSTVQVILVPG